MSLGNLPVWTASNFDIIPVYLSKGGLLGLPSLLWTNTNSVLSGRVWGGGEGRGGEGKGRGGGGGGEAICFL